MANYPASKDDATSLPNPSGVATQNNPDHGALHTNENAAIIALENKVGTGASTPTANTFLFGTGTGTSAWTQATSAQVAAAVSDETGTGALVFAATPTLITPKIDTINEATVGNGTTVGGVNIRSGFISGSNITAGTVANSALAAGVAVQQVNSVTSAVATGTTIIPTDDTIPQNTEGDQYMSVSITPKSATNSLVINVVVQMSCSAATTSLVVALFKDSIANALAANSSFQATATASMAVPLQGSMVAATTSAITFKVRCGPSNAATLTFNGSGGSRVFSSINKSSIVVTEYKA